MDFIARNLLTSCRRLTGTPHDVVVMCADNVRDSSKQYLADLGAIILPVQNIENPFHSGGSKSDKKYKKRFLFALNKLHLWSLTQYERVIYLDSDNIAISKNMDELFLCGHFCAVYQNPMFFHTGTCQY